MEGNELNSICGSSLAQLRDLGQTWATNGWATSGNPRIFCRLRLLDHVCGENNKIEGGRRPHEEGLFMGRRPPMIGMYEQIITL